MGWTVEVVQEFAHAFARRRDRAEAARIARGWAVLLASLINTTRDGLTLFQGHPALGAFDTLLIGAAPSREAHALVSAHAAFGDIPGLPFVDLGTPALDAVVAGER